MITKVSTTYWATGITVHCDGERWGGHVDFYDDGFANDDPDTGAISTEGTLRTRYLVRDGEHVTALTAVLDTLAADAERLGIRLAGPAQSAPSLYYRLDGEDPDSPPPANWRQALTVEAARRGWECPYGPPPTVAWVSVDDRARRGADRCVGGAHDAAAG